MTVVHSRAELRAELDRRWGEHDRIAYVPTMGALHAGHGRLLEVARERGDVVVASCYVNPTQFGVGEDLDRYPRTPQADAVLAEAAGVDLLWLPSDEDVYGSTAGEVDLIRVGAIGEVLEGATRPGHFDGVASVVVRLLDAVRPDELVLGRKDHQQVVVLRDVLRRLELPVRIVEVDTVREGDGLAMSSRNAYLGPMERQVAATLPHALALADAAARAGERDARAIERTALEVLGGGAPALQVEYVTLVRAGTVEPLDRLADGELGVLLAAVRVGSTRLIDNIPIAAGDAGA
jgi:pantoate--beta-alanine ligase